MILLIDSNARRKKRTVSSLRAKNYLCAAITYEAAELAIAEREGAFPPPAAVAVLMPDGDVSRVKRIFFLLTAACPQCTTLIFSQYEDEVFYSADVYGKKENIHESIDVAAFLDTYAKRFVDGLYSFPLRIVPATGEVSYFYRELLFSRYCFDLLRLLAYNEEKRFSASVIRMVIPFASDDAVRVCVSKINRTAKRSTGYPLISCEYGRGYYFTKKIKK